MPSFPPSNYYYRPSPIPSQPEPPTQVSSPAHADFLARNASPFGNGFGPGSNSLNAREK